MPTRGLESKLQDARPMAPEPLYLPWVVGAPLSKPLGLWVKQAKHLRKEWYGYILMETWRAGVHDGERSGCTSAALGMHPTSTYNTVFALIVSQTIQL